jgi:hypothetical protein
VGRLVERDELVLERLAHEMLPLHRVAEIPKRRGKTGGLALQPHLHIDDVEGRHVDESERSRDRVGAGAGAIGDLLQLLQRLGRKSRRIWRGARDSLDECREAAIELPQGVEHAIADSGHTR